MSNLEKRLAKKTEEVEGLEVDKSVLEKTLADEPWESDTPEEEFFDAPEEEKIDPGTSNDKDIVNEQYKQVLA